MWENAKYTIQDNTIAGGFYGITTAYSGEVGLQLTIVQNNFENISRYKIYWDASYDLTATHNWWGTTDTQAINQTIYDSKYDFNLGTVNFVPFLTEPNPEAMPDPNAPIPTPTPEQTPATSPTPTPDQKPTSTPDQEPQQTEQIEPIVVAAIVVIIFCAVPGVLIYLIKRK